PEGAPIESVDGTESTLIVNAQSVVAADPETSHTVLPETGQRASRHSNRGHLVPPKRVQTSRAADPDGPIGRGEHGLDNRGGELGRRRKRDDRALSETVQTARRCHPDIPFAVLKKTVHDVTREAVFAAEMIHTLTGHSVYPFGTCSHP